MEEALLVLGLFGGFIVALAGILLVGKQSAHPANFGCQPVQPHPIPYRGRTVLFSKAERSFYQTLRAVVPDHMIFVKVKLADLICLRPRQSVWEYFSPINRKRIDFVICDPTLAPVLAIELDEAGNAAADGATANLVDSVLANASLPLVHVAQKRSYLFNELRRLVSPYLSVPRPLL
jgi:arginine/lysine/ornithine decarboxylase